MNLSQDAPVTDAPGNAAKPMAGRRVLVTGAARRIGRVLALAMAEAGADVAITYRDGSIRSRTAGSPPGSTARSTPGSLAEAEATVAELVQFGGSACAVPCDVRDEGSVEQAVAETVLGLGGLDILVNNAGAFEAVPLEEISARQWDAMFETNTRGPFFMAKAALPHLRAAGGRIVNIGSLGGLHPWATHGHYCSSKAALHMLSQTMAKAWAPEISVNCIAPGMIVTTGEISSGYRHFAEKTPMRRNGTPEDVAAALLFFATAPKFITGQLLAVDGGLGL